MTSKEDLPLQASGKLEQKVIDFERLDEAGLKEGNWDVVFITCVFSFLFLVFSMWILRCGLDWARPRDLQALRRISQRLTRSA